MNLVHIITGLEIGGAELALCRLVESLAAPRYRHVVIVLGRRGVLSERIGVNASRLVHLNMPRSAPSLLPWVRLRRTLRALAPDVVHAWMYHANVTATVASLGTGIPVLWGVRQTVYDLAREKPVTRMVIRTGKLLSGQPRRIIYNSMTSARQHEALGYRSDKTHFIPNGFDTQQFKPDLAARRTVRARLGVSDDAFLIGLVARWHPMKDHGNFLQAAAKFAATRSSAAFLLVGTGLDRANQRLVQRLHALGLAGCVHLCGPRNDIAAINAAVDVATLSSAWGEAFPNAIGEAMACGTPCVATSVGDVPEILAGVGAVVAPGDPDALAAAWRKIGDLTAQERTALGQAGRARIIGRYSLPNVSRQYMDLYADVLTERAGG